MTRKRYIKLCMGDGMQRNEAVKSAKQSRESCTPYKTAFVNRVLKQREIERKVYKKIEALLAPILCLLGDYGYPLGNYGYPFY